MYAILLKPGLELTMHIHKHTYQNMSSVVPKGF